MRFPYQYYLDFEIDNDILKEKKKLSLDLTIYYPLSYSIMSIVLRITGVILILSIVSFFFFCFCFYPDFCVIFFGKSFFYFFVINVLIYFIIIVLLFHVSKALKHSNKFFSISVETKKISYNFYLISKKFLFKLVKISYKFYLILKKVFSKLFYWSYIIYIKLLPIIRQQGHLCYSQHKELYDILRREYYVACREHKELIEDLKSYYEILSSGELWSWQHFEIHEEGSFVRKKYLIGYIYIYHEKKKDGTIKTSSHFISVDLIPKDYPRKHLAPLKKVFKETIEIKKPSNGKLKMFVTIT